jgi:2'-5' RNA ligase
VRAFFAVELPAALRSALAVRVGTAALKAPDAPADVRWLDGEQYHVTLKFLGEIPERRVPELLRAAARKLARSEPFRAQLGGFGAFPDARAARVAWVGVGAGSAALARLAHKLDAAAQVLEVPRERRPFHAHITIGRLAQPAPLALAQLGEPLEGEFEVGEVVLFESQLGAHGSRYRACARIALPPDEASAPDVFDEFAPEL